MIKYLSPLNESDLQAFGINGWSYGMGDKVRFHELDALNHVNNVIYLRWFETIRVMYMQDYGFTGYTHTDADPQLVVRAQTADYLVPLQLDETYILTARTCLIKPSSFIMDYAVHVEGQTRCTGTTVMVSLRQDGNERRRHNASAIDNVISRDGALADGFT